MGGFPYSLVGIPYKPGGTTPEGGFDCYGLVRYVIREKFAVELPEKTVNWRSYGRVIRSPRNVKPYDVVMMWTVEAGVVDHIGIAVDAENMLHTASIFGASVVDRIARYSPRIVAVGRVGDAD